MELGNPLDELSPPEFGPGYFARADAGFDEPWVDRVGQDEPAAGFVADRSLAQRNCPGFACPLVHILCQKEVDCLQLLAAECAGDVDEAGSYLLGSSTDEEGVSLVNSFVLDAQFDAENVPLSCRHAVVPRRWDLCQIPAIHLAQSIVAARATTIPSTEATNCCGLNCPYTRCRVFSSCTKWRSLFPTVHSIVRVVFNPVVNERLITGWPSTVTLNDLTDW